MVIHSPRPRVVDRCDKCRTPKRTTGRPAAAARTCATETTKTSIRPLPHHSTLPVVIWRPYRVSRWSTVIDKQTPRQPPGTYGRRLLSAPHHFAHDTQRSPRLHTDPPVRMWFAVTGLWINGQSTNVNTTLPTGKTGCGRAHTKLPPPMRNDTVRRSSAVAGYERPATGTAACRKTGPAIAGRTLRPFHM